MPISITYFRQIIVFVLVLERVFAESYVKLWNFVTILQSLVKYKVVCVHMSGEVDSLYKSLFVIIPAAQ